MLNMLNTLFGSFKYNYIISVETTEITDQFSNIQLRSSASSDLPLSREKTNTNNKPNCSAPLQWNPFEDSTPFDQMTEDHIYEAEFDALRDRPSGMFTTNKYEKTHIVCPLRFIFYLILF